MDDCDWLLSVEKACAWLRIEPGVTRKFFLGHPVVGKVQGYRWGVMYDDLVNITVLVNILCCLSEIQ